MALAECYGTPYLDEYPFSFMKKHTIAYRPLAQLLNACAIGAGGLEFNARAGQIGTVSPTARHRFDVSSELCSPGAKPRRWAPPFVTRLGIIPRV